jgi:hypothetical protein
MNAVALFVLYPPGKIVIMNLDISPAIFRCKSHCEKRKERIGETMVEEEKKPDCVYVVNVKKRTN